MTTTGRLGTTASRLGLIVLGGDTTVRHEPGTRTASVVQSRPAATVVQSRPAATVVQSRPIGSVAQ